MGIVQQFGDVSVQEAGILHEARRARVGLLVGDAGQSVRRIVAVIRVRHLRAGPAAAVAAAGGGVTREAVVLADEIVPEHNRLVAHLAAAVAGLELPDHGEIIQIIVPVLLAKARRPADRVIRADQIAGVVGVVDRDVRQARVLRRLADHPARAVVTVCARARVDVIDTCQQRAVEVSGFRCLFSSFTIEERMGFLAENSFAQVDSELPLPLLPVGRRLSDCGYLLHHAVAP